MMMMIALAASVAAVAQTEGPAGDALEEIVVTARLVRETIQDVPLAVSAIGGDTLERSGVTDLRALTEQFAGIQLDATGGKQFSAPVIRGLSQVSRSDDENNVSVFVDGVYVSGRDGLDTNLLDLERVEVVRGPQSALYGRNSYAGAINYITRKPDDEFRAQVTGTGGSDDRARFTATASGPLVADTLYFRLGGGYDQWDGTYQNSTSLPLNGYESKFFSGGLRYRATETFEANANLYYADDDIGQAAQVIFPGNCQASPPFNQSRAFCGEYPDFGDDVDFSGYDSRAYGPQREIFRSSLNLEWTFDGATLTALTGYNQLQTQSILDQDRQLPGVPFALLNLAAPMSPPSSANLTTLIASYGSLEEASQDLRLASRSDSRLQWLLGANYYWYRNRSRSPAAIDTTPVPAGLVPAVSLAPGLGNLFVRIPAGFDPIEDFRFYFADSRKQTDTWAGYGSLSWAFDAGVTARAELRYTSERKQILQLPAAREFSDTFTYWTPRFTLDYRWTEDVLVYASAAKGAKAGGFNAAAPTPAELAYDPETNWTYEIGAKTDLLDRRLRVNLAIFHIEMEDIQITNPSAVQPAVFITRNAGTGESQGFELEVSYRPTESWTFNAAYSLADAEFVDASDGSLRSYPAFATNQDVSGQRLPRQAEHLVNLAAEFRTPAFGSFDWSTRVDGRYESERNASTHELLGYAGSRTIVNARTGFDNGNLDVSLWVRNALDDDTITLAQSALTLNTFLSAPAATLPDLRSYGVTVSYRF